MSIFNDKTFLLLPMKYFVGKKLEWQPSDHIWKDEFVSFALVEFQ